MFFVYTLILIVRPTPFITRKMLDHSRMSLSEQHIVDSIFLMGHARSIGNRVSVRVATQAWAKLCNQTTLCKSASSFFRLLDAPLISAVYEHNSCMTFNSRPCIICYRAACLQGLSWCSLGGLQKQEVSCHTRFNFSFCSSDGDTTVWQ